ncbi:hypothetical protein CsSME_00024751 [Camellia sinensis var. sinensis]
MSMDEQEDHGGRHSRASASRLTRSQVAPDWSSQESLTLITEIAAVERDCRNTLSSFQKWKIIVENCNSLEVFCTLNQCRRKWDSLLSDYKKIKLWESSESQVESYWSIDYERRREFGFPEDFDFKVFKAIDDHLKVGDGSDTDPDVDPEAVADGVAKPTEIVFDLALEDHYSRATSSALNLHDPTKNKEKIDQEQWDGWRWLMVGTVGVEREKGEGSGCWSGWGREVVLVGGRSGLDAKCTSASHISKHEVLTSVFLYFWYRRFEEAKAPSDASETQHRGKGDASET